MPDVGVDMSPAAVARRLAAMAELHRLGLSLRAAHHLGPARQPVAEMEDPARDRHRPGPDPARRQVREGSSPEEEPSRLLPIETSKVSQTP